MATWMREVERGEPSRLSAQQQWKRRWNGYLAGSIAVAGVLHVAVLVGWPAAHVSPLAPRVDAKVLHVLPLASQPLPPLPAPPDRPADELEHPPPDVDPPPDPFAALDAPRPQLARAASANRTPASSAGLVLHSIRVAMPPHGISVPNFNWPTIRNPTLLERFLRRQYNPIHHDPGRERHASVAIALNERGRVEWATIHASSGVSAIDDIALAAFNDIVEFSPATRAGVPIPIVIVLSVPFSMPW